jgi:hypothetical protein
VAFPTTAVLDNTTRADESPLSDGGKWTTPVRTGDEQLQLVSNLVGAAGAASSFPNAGWNNATFGPSSEAWYTINSWDTFNLGTVFFAYVNIQALGVAGPTYYGVDLTLNTAGNPNNLTLRRTGANNWAVSEGLGLLPSPVVAGDQLGLRSNGQIIEAWFQHAGTWTLVASEDDAVKSGTTGLPAGFIGWGQQFPGINGNPVRMSVFGGGTATITNLGRLPLLGAG